MINHQTILPTSHKSDYTSIMVDCIAMKSGKREIVTKAFSSKKSYSIYDGDMDTMDTMFTLEKTKREIQQCRLILEPGCIITDADGTYRCTSITYTEAPKHPILHTKYIGPA